MTSSPSADNEAKKTNWKDEWIGMPEFFQPKVKPYAQIIVRFENEADLDDFSQKIGQKLTSKTKSIWHPKLIPGQQSGTHLRYVDESAIPHLCDQQGASQP